MPSPDPSAESAENAAAPTAAAEGKPPLLTVLGTLNFSSGGTDAAFASAMNAVFADARPRTWDDAGRLLADELTDLKARDPAFSDATQAAGVLDVTFRRMLPAYRTFHADLLGHLRDGEDFNPFLLAAALNAVLKAGPPWDEADRVAAAAIDTLNDFVGYRPIATLENGRRSSVYSHERHRPLPLFVRGAGVAVGPWHDLVTATLGRLEGLPSDLLFASQFDPQRLDELALDLRAYDHLHPVTKRTNYPFGEWDPDIVDADGYFRRFVVRRVIFQGLAEWIDEGPGDPRDRLRDAADVLGGTILMAAAVSGAGPGAHGSDVSLLTMLPDIAARRDAYYDRLMRDAGPDTARLRRTTERYGQPYGDIRQFLNLRLADRGARQVRRQHAAFQLARLGRSDAAGRHAGAIDCTSARLETAVRCAVAEGKRAVRAAEADAAWAAVREAFALIDRGVGCGAFADPWNGLGFAGQFPLFAAREDAIPDHRLETLAELQADAFALAIDAIAAAAAAGEECGPKLEELRGRAETWDRYAFGAVSDLPDVSGAEAARSAEAVATALGGVPDATGDEADEARYWRDRVDALPHADAYARVVERLLARDKSETAVGVLLHWLGRVAEVGTGGEGRSLFELLETAFETRLDGPPEERADRVARFFRFLEANAEEFWLPPEATTVLDPGEEAADGDSGPDALAGEPLADPDDEPASDEETETFAAAYEGISFRDSADDGQDGPLMEEGGPGGTGDGSDFDAERRMLAPRLRFLTRIAKLRLRAAEAESAVSADAAAEWLAHGEEVLARLGRLVATVERAEIETFGDDSEANAVYDDAVQARAGLLRDLSRASAEFRFAGLLAAARLDHEETGDEGPLADERRLVASVLRADAVAIRRDLSLATERLVGKPLLYVSFEYGGKADDVIAARVSERLLQFLVRRLPRLGLVGETLDVLRLALRMERAGRMDGPAVTEFDRLFKTALTESLVAICRGHRAGPPSRIEAAPAVASAIGRRSSGGTDRPKRRHLLRDVAAVVEAFQESWDDHGRTMRLSAAELLTDDRVWRRVRRFIRDYGGDLLHARMMTIGNLRSILARGVETFVTRLRDGEEDFDRGGSGRVLAEALRDDRLSADRAGEALEPIFATVLDRLERYVEYNTTTTHSDYGDRLDRFLEFVRLEARYERDGWGLLPQTLAHRVLAEHGPQGYAEAWADSLRRRTAEPAAAYLAELADLEREHAMRLPSVTDHLEERFVRPIAIDRLLAAVPDDPLAAEEDAATADDFARLEAAIDAQLDTPPGSSVDLPEWLRKLERRVDVALSPRGRPEPDAVVTVPPARIVAQLDARGPLRNR